jgi:hypothetical protein
MPAPVAVNILGVLESIYEAQEILRDTPVDDVERVEMLERAIDTAISVVVIYLKLGRAPRVMEKHLAGIERLNKVLDVCRTTC